MARVTVEDCITKIPNRFELVMVASQRARNISAGMALEVERDNDKNPVVALREIADNHVDQKELEEALIKGLQKFVEIDKPEEDEVDLIAIQQELTVGEGEATTDAAKAEKPSDEGQAAAMDMAGDVTAEDEKPGDGDKEA